MKWIGQHIWDFISRFRSDIYMEAVESGTIVSGGNLGLDANNKVVKADTETGELTLSNGVNDRVVTALGANTLNAESTLEYSGASKIMKIGADDDGVAQVGRQLHTSDDGGQLIIFGGSPTLFPSSTNKSGGNLILQGGYATGSGTGGKVVISTTKGVAGGSTTANLQSATVTVSEANVHLEEDVTLSFEGASDNGHETRVTVVDPTGDRTITLPDATGTVALTSDIPDETVSTGSFISKQVKVTLSQANCNSLHAIPIGLIPAQGANTIIVPAGGIMMVDRNSAQNNSAADLNFHYADREPGTYGQTALFHIRRFMVGNTTDIVYSLGELSGIEISQNLTDCVNKAVEVSVDSALTTNSMTSITIYLTYHVIDIS